MNLPAHLRRAPILDMNELANRMQVPPLEQSSDTYAPKERQEKLVQMVVRTVETFGALPTTEIDEVLRAAESEIAALKAEAQEIRDTYVNRTQVLVADIKRMTEGCALARKTLDTLRTQVQALDAAPPAQPVLPAAVPETPPA